MLLHNYKYCTFTSTLSLSQVFTPGAGTQLMLRTQDPAIKGRGIMDDVARSVLSMQELATFNYYLDQYEHKGLPIEDLVTPLLDLFDTAEKVSLSLVIVIVHGFRPESENVDPGKKRCHRIGHLKRKEQNGANFSSVATSSEEL